MVARLHSHSKENLLNVQELEGMVLPYRNVWQNFLILSHENASFLAIHQRIDLLLMHMQYNILVELNGKKS
jgi:hypothetical protein